MLLHERPSGRACYSWPKELEAHGAAPWSEMNAQLVEVLQQIRGWLLSEAVLRSTGSGLGVVNYINPDGSWNGLYPEICGYYLQFAAAAAPAVGTDSDASFRRVAAGVATWLDAMGGPAAEPLTLYHHDMANSDWRNRCLFAFDLAIIRRGLAAAEARWPGLVPVAVSDRYSASLARVVKNGRLTSHRLRAGASPSDIPLKWSTTPGVHHVKAAAAVAPLRQPDLSATADETLRDEAMLFERDSQSRMRELHPFLYFIEGWLMLWGQTQNFWALANAVRAFEMVLGQIDPRTGLAPPVANMRHAGARSDVLAQALRAGIVLEAAGQLTGQCGDMWRRRRHPLLIALLQRVAPDGGIIFDLVGNHRNAWASMFAWQALLFFTKSQAGTLDPAIAAASLI
jgi:hypothetical protein